MGSRRGKEKELSRFVVLVLQVSGKGLIKPFHNCIDRSIACPVEELPFPVVPWVYSAILSKMQHAKMYSSVGVMKCFLGRMYTAESFSSIPTPGLS